MTVIRPNSISGITSLTAHRGSIDFYAHDGSAATFNNINSNVTSGVSTFASLNITGDLDVGGALTYEDVTNVDSIGVITARAGVSITGGDLTLPDAIVHAGDTNTKIRFPAADTFTVETAGSERFRIDSTGNTLIYGVLRKDNVNSSLSISGGNGADSSANIVLHGSSGSPANVIQFRTGSTERVRITSAGNVGINDTAPSEKLNVGGNIMLEGSDQYLYLTNVGTGNAGMYIRGRDATSELRSHSTGMFTWEVTGSEKMRLDSAGRLLLNSGTDVRIELGTTGSAGTNNRNHLRGDGTNMKYNCCAGGGHFFEANGGERLRIDSGGRVNIGDAHLSQTSSSFHVGRNAGGTAAGESVIAATLGNDSTMVSALLTVRNAGNRGNQGNNSGSPLAKFEFNNGTAFEIDKNGYRTLPYQPSAMAYNAQGQHMGGGSIAQFNSTRFNIGNMYNSSNGRMTVPKTGTYLVAYSGLHDYISQSAVGFEFRINGSVFNGGEAYQESNNISNSQLAKTLILYLSANDYVEIYLRISGTQVHQRYGSFSMTLLT